MAKKFPKTIYVKWDGDKGAEFLQASESPDAAIEMPGDDNNVAVYTIREIVELEQPPVVVKHVRMK